MRRHVNSLARLIGLILLIGSTLVTLQQPESVRAAGTASCSYVVKAAVVAAWFCPDTSGCRGDNLPPSVMPPTFSCTVSPNPIQSAIDWDSSNSGDQVLLDSGTFNITTHQIGLWAWKIGLFIPSNVLIYGKHDTAYNPLTIIRADAKDPVTQAPVTLDTVILLAGHRYDPNQALTTTGLNNVLVDANQKSQFGIIAGKTQNFVQFYGDHITNTKMSAMMLGIVATWETTDGGTTAKVYPFNGFNDSNPNIVSGIKVLNSGIDGIFVTGSYTKIENSTVMNSNSVHANGIGVYSTSEYIRIQNNTITNFRTGIGIDGSFPAYCAPPCSLDYYNQLSADRGRGKPYGSPREITMANNTITTPNLTGEVYGIHLWRTYQSHIHQNLIQGTGYVGTGIHLNESDSNFVWSNTIKYFNQGLRLNSNGYGGRTMDGNPTNQIGTSFNGIGLDSSFNVKANTITSNTIGIKLIKSNNSIAEGHIRSNTFRNNDLRTTTYPCEYSGSDTGGDRQYASGQLGGTCNYPYYPDAIQGP